VIALRLVRFIELHSDPLARGLLEKFLHSAQTEDLKKVPAGELHDRSHAIFFNLSDWLMGKSEAEIERLYADIGARRAAQGVALPHLLAAIMMTKTHLWEFLERQGVLEKPGEIFGELELLRHLDRFFDRALFYATKGYEEEVQRRRVAELHAA
jgi:hypothetical protein